MEEKEVGIPDLGVYFPDVAVIITSSLVILLAFFVRSWNSRHLLNVIRPAGNKPVFSAMSIGFMCNALMPFRIGEIVRAYVLGTDLAVSRVVIFLLVLLERAIDSLIISTYALVLYFLGSKSGIVFHDSYVAISVMVFLAGTGIIVMLWLLASQQKWLLREIYKGTRLFNDHIRDKVRHTAWSAIYGLNIVYRYAPFSRYIAYALLMWAIYIVAIVILVRVLFSGSPQLVMQILSVSSYLSVAVPSGPGYFGTFHYYLSSNLSSVLDGNLDAKFAYVFTFLVWFVFLIPITVIGFVSFSKRWRIKERNRVTAVDPMLNKLYREEDISGELSHFLDEYFSCTELSQIINKREITGDLRLIETLKGGSNAKTLIFSRPDGTRIVRKIALLQHADKLVSQYGWFRSRRNIPNLPEILEEGKDTVSYHYDMKHYANYVPFFDFIHSNPVGESIVILKDILGYLTANIYVGGYQTRSDDDLTRYINEKVLRKINDAALLNKDIGVLILHPKIIINGVQYDNLFHTLDDIQKNKAMMDDLSSYYSAPIHGDLTIDNILVNRDKQFILLDPNNENYISDPLIDLAKLYQSLHSGYEFINNLETVYTHDAEVVFDERRSLKYHEIFDALVKELEHRHAGSMRVILFHEAVHYCRMLTYRCRINPSTAPAFYAIAVRLFNQYRSQYITPTFPHVVDH